MPFTLFSGTSTYERPGASYIALRQILGHGRFTKALEEIQRRYGGRSITEAKFEAVFHEWLPVRSAACQARLSQFFAQWFDTAYPAAGGGQHRPQITGPGLPGPGFYGHGCKAPLGSASSSLPAPGISPASPPPPISRR